MKSLDINKASQDLYVENLKILMKERNASVGGHTTFIRIQ